MRRVLFILALLLASNLSWGQCEIADALANSGYFDEAKKAYSQLLGKDPAPACANSGLNGLKDRQTKLSIEVAQQQDDPVLALAAIEAGLKVDPLNKLLSEQADSFRSKIVDYQKKLGASLADIGDYSAAADAYAKGLEYDPTNESLKIVLRSAKQKAAIAEVKALAKTGKHSEAATKFFALAKEDSVVAQIDPAELGLGWYVKRQNGITALGYAAELLILGGVIAILLIRLFQRYALPPLLMVEKFEAEGISLKIGDGFAAMVQSAVSELTGGGGEAPVDMMVSRPIHGSDIPSELYKALPEAASWLQALPALWKNFIPRRAWRVSGSLHYSKVRGAGVSVHLTRGRKTTLSQTLWQKKFDKNVEPADEADDGAPFFQLGRYVATWILFRIDHNKRFRPLGAKDWRAYASFLAGVQADLKNEQEHARDYYVQALRYDLSFNAPRFNLALRVPKEQRELTLDPLRRAVEGSADNDPTRYQARYTLASRLYQLDRGDEGLLEAGILVKEIREKLDDLEIATDTDNKATGDDQALESYLEFCLPIAEALWAGLTIWVEEMLAPTVVLGRLYRQAGTPRAYYNLAAAYALTVQVAETKEVATADKANQLQTGDRKRYLLQAVARIGVVRGRYLRRAIKCLQIAKLLNRAFTIDPDDKTWRSLKNSNFQVGTKTVAELFVALVKPTSPPRSRLPLAQIKKIGKKGAGTLEKNGIKTGDELILAADSQKKRDDLAKKLKIGALELQNWAGSAELMKLVGIGVKEVNLLNAAGVLCIGHLTAYTPPDLEKHFMDWATSEKYGAPPDFSTVYRWIEHAGKYPTMIP